MLYYDCQIEAAYMKKAFSVTFTEPFGNIVKFVNKVQGFVWVYKTDRVHYGNCYIHRAYLDFFKPKVGDVMGGEIAGYKRKVNHKNIKEYRRLVGEGKSRIIERDEKPFIMPKMVVPSVL